MSGLLSCVNKVPATGLPPACGLTDNPLPGASYGCPPNLDYARNLYGTLPLCQTVVNQSSLQSYPQIEPNLAQPDISEHHEVQKPLGFCSRVEIALPALGSRPIPRFPSTVAIVTPERDRSRTPGPIPAFWRHFWAFRAFSGFLGLFRVYAWLRSSDTAISGCQSADQWF